MVSGGSNGRSETTGIAQQDVVVGLQSHHKRGLRPTPLAAQCWRLGRCGRCLIFGEQGRKSVDAVADFFCSGCHRERDGLAPRDPTGINAKDTFRLDTGPATVCGGRALSDPSY